jgi:general secretion pathway protein G
MTPEGRIEHTPEQSAGFTLLEMMAVVLLMGLVATLVGYNVQQAMEGARATKTKAQLAMLESALERFQLEKGRYPANEEGLDVLLPAYVRRADSLLDGWGRRFEYRSPAERSPFGYDLWSWGRDGAPGGAELDADVLGWDEARAS